MAVSRLSQQSIQQAFPKGNTVWDGTTATSAFDSLGTVVLSANSTTVTFSNIPQTYAHLQVRYVTRTSTTNSGSWSSMVFSTSFNSGATGYNNHILYGDGSQGLSTYEGLTNRINFGTTSGNGALANSFGSGVFEILDYTNTSKFKTVRFLDGFDNNGSGLVALRSGLWQSSSAISSITFGPENFAGLSYLTGTSFSLYGIK
jgi:hypothetical protein